jgi:hypothetical protein
VLTDNDLKSYINGYLQDRKMSYTRLDKHDRAIEILINENKKLHSIIKEAREYIENPRHEMSVNTYQGLLEILDKVGKENDIEFDVLKALNTDLDDDVEIIEEDKKIPEKIEEKEIEISMSIGEQICANKINGIIDYLNREK